jgi:hypothetical protein
MNEISSPNIQIGLYVVRFLMGIKIYVETLQTNEIPEGDKVTADAIKSAWTE